MPEISLQKLLYFFFEPLPRAVAGGGDYDIGSLLDLLLRCCRLLFFHGLAAFIGVSPAPSRGPQSLRKYHCNLCLSWPSRDCWSWVEALALIACLMVVRVFSMARRGSYVHPAAKATYLLNGTIRLSSCFLGEFITSLTKRDFWAVL